MSKIAYILWLFVIGGAGLTITANEALQSIGFGIWSLGVAIQIILGIYFFMPKMLSLIAGQTRPTRVTAPIQDEPPTTGIERSLGQYALPELEEIEGNTGQSGQKDAGRRGAVVKRIKPEAGVHAKHLLTRVLQMFETQPPFPTTPPKPRGASSQSPDKSKNPEEDPEEEGPS